MVSAGKGFRCVDSERHGCRTHYFQQFEEVTTPRRIAKPVIASVRSIAIGKGFEPSLFCVVTISSGQTGRHTTGAPPV